MENEKIYEVLVSMQSSLAGIDQRLNKMDERFEKMDERFEKMDERFEKIDECFEKMDRRMDSLEQQAIKTNLMIENEVMGHIKALYDGMAMHTDQLDRIISTLDTLQVTVNDIQIKTLRHENIFLKLKKAL